jgi:DNA-binding transcriptional regulator YiaG
MTMKEHPEPWTEEDARNFRAWRERRQRSQRVCALVMGYSISTVRAWEHGRRKPSQAARRRIESEFADPRGAAERLAGICRTPRRPMLPLIPLD